MNNEPVAWISEYTLKNCLQGNFTDEVRATTKETTNCTIPLYTHPVKELTQNITGVWRLSDQSIQIVFTSCRSASEFVEILRKANEK